MLVLPWWIEAQWQWFCFTWLPWLPWTHVKTSIDRSKTQRPFSFSKCVVMKGWKAKTRANPIVKALPSTYPKYVGLSCHSHGPWLTGHHRGRILENAVVMSRHAPVASRFWKMPLTQEWKKLEANGFIRIFIQMRDDQVAWKKQLFLSSDEQFSYVFLHVSKNIEQRDWNMQSWNNVIIHIELSNSRIAVADLTINTWMLQVLSWQSGWSCARAVCAGRDSFWKDKRYNKRHVYTIFHICCIILNAFCHWCMMKHLDVLYRSILYTVYIYTHTFTYTSRIVVHDCFYCFILLWAWIHFFCFRMKWLTPRYVWLRKVEPIPRYHRCEGSQSSGWILATWSGEDRSHLGKNGPKFWDMRKHMSRMCQRSQCATEESVSIVIAQISKCTESFFRNHFPFFGSLSLKFASSDVALSKGMCKVVVNVTKTYKDLSSWRQPQAAMLWKWSSFLQAAFWYFLMLSVWINGFI